MPCNLHKMLQKQTKRSEKDFRTKSEKKINKSKSKLHRFFEKKNSYVMPLTWLLYQKYLWLKAKKKSAKSSEISFHDQKDELLKTRIN